ncbi:MAG TPA: ABC transporter substrate-binding protein [Terriglobales bacterium]|nr:ABC transporter substrate-binding protein [Terriglobales bacterium]
MKLFMAPRRRLPAALIPIIAFVTFFVSGSLVAYGVTRVTVHVPSKSLAIMPYYFGKDKGFFSPEAIDLQLVVMSPPTAIAALVAGELDFSSTLGAATSAIMRGLPLRRLFYVQQDPSHVLLAQPEIKTVQDLSGKVIAVTALTDAVGMSASTILKGSGVDTAQVTLLATQVSDNAYKALISGNVAATLMAPPYAEELEAKGYRRLAEARSYAPLSFIGLVSTIDALKKNSQKAYALIAGLHRTMVYIHNPANRAEVVRYIAGFHKIDLPLAEKAFAAQLPSYSKDGTKPRKSVEREIEIYRETLKIAKNFTPDDLEDMSLLKKVQESAR